MSIKAVHSFAGLVLILVLTAMAFVPSAVRAAGPWYVATTGNDANDCLGPTTPCATINGAISKATAGDTINIAIGTYTGSGTEVVLIDRSITLSGGWDATFSTQSGKSTVDGEGARRGIQINNLSSVTMERFIVQNCFTAISQTPGAINLNGSLTLNNSDIQNNQTTGIYSDSPMSTNLAVSNSSIIGNTSPDILNIPGGVVSGNGANETISNSVISGNSGGGLFISGLVSINASNISDNTGSQVGAGIINFGTLGITSSVINGNETASGTDTFGGGIFNLGSLTITDSVISSNVSGVGGGIYNEKTLQIITSTVFNNTATVDGGGIYVIGGQSSNYVIAINSTISNNRGGNGGGLYFDVTLFNQGALGDLRSVTITQNTATDADGKGGGIFVQSNNPFVDLRDSLLVNNTATGGADCSGSVKSDGYNIIGNNDGCQFGSFTGDQIGTPNSPISAQLGPLADNGGSTPTIALLAGSPAIDANDDVFCPATDQRGIARPQGPACDIGAFELEVSNPVIEVSIDIKPGDKRNHIEIERGDDESILVAILSTDQFNAPQVVDRSSLTFGATGDEKSLKLNGRKQTPDCQVRDVNKDGRSDLVCKFRLSRTGFQPGVTTGTLKGFTVNGIPIEGSDSVVIKLDD